MYSCYDKLMNQPVTYTPGVCNIGEAEIRLRRQVGFSAGASTLFAVLACYFLHISPKWACLIFFPATISALGFIQARMHFCVNFGMRGLFNVSSELRHTESIDQTEWRKKDQQTAIIIIVAAILAAIAVTIICYALLSLLFI